MTDIFEGLHLSPWYLNTRRLNEYRRGAIPSLAQETVSKNSVQRANAMEYAASIAEQLLASGHVKSLVSIYDTLTGDAWQICYIWDVLTFRGAVAAYDQARSRRGKTSASFSGNIQVGDRQVKVHGKLAVEHFYSNSTTTLMAGRTRAMLCGQVRRCEQEDEIEVHPIIVGQMALDFAGFKLNWQNYLRVYPGQMDAFASMENAGKVTAADSKRMLSLSEDEVKNAIAEIVGEPFIPKDWGGEKSDLSTSRMSVSGVPTSVAFILKGPSVPGPLHPANMGKRGDQLIRAFEEPVDIVVIQHCAKIENTVVRLAEALAANPGGPKRYCILDGADTYRLLKAYGKIPISN